MNSNGFSSARRKDSISELDLSSVKQTGTDMRQGTKRSSLSKTKFAGANQTGGNLFPDIVNQQPTKRNNLVDQIDASQSAYSSRTNENRKKLNGKEMDVQSLKSS